METEPSTELSRRVWSSLQTLPALLPFSDPGIPALQNHHTHRPGPQALSLEGASHFSVPSPPRHEGQGRSPCRWTGPANLALFTFMGCVPACPTTTEWEFYSLIPTSPAGPPWAAKEPLLVHSDSVLSSPLLPDVQHAPTPQPHPGHQPPPPDPELCYPP